MKIADAISAIARSWDAVASLDESRIPRLSLLKTLGERIHALRSEALALNDHELMRNIDIVESKLNALRNLPAPASSTELRRFLLESNPAPPSSQAFPREILPDTLHAALGGREKLMRNDRAWERSIASAACQAGWIFWSLEAKVPLEAVETWHEDVKRTLWPDGLILFVESSGNTVSEKGTWPGRWIIILRAGSPPRIPPMKAHSIHTKWNLLFTPSGT